MSVSLFDKYGGFAAINTVVLEFYNLVLDSDDIGHFFDGTDMTQLIDHQTKFVSFLLGGPVSYEDARLRAAHASLAIKDGDFDAIKTLLRQALETHEFEPADIDTVIAAIDGYRPSIVS